jgi:hypothetical protein
MAALERLANALEGSPTGEAPAGNYQHALEVMLRVLEAEEFGDAVISLIDLFAPRSKLA